MLCDECKKNQATYHEIKKINGVSTERHFCAACQAAMAKNQAAVDFNEMFSGFKGLFSAPKKANVLKCSRCGTTSEEFLETAYLGCPECYNELKSVVNPVIQRVQNAGMHTGKSIVPKAAQDDRSEHHRLQALLEDAINRNDMAEAEAVFNRIRKLKNA